MIFPKKLFAFDVETTGTNPDFFNIVQIGCLILDQNLNIEWEFSSYIKPSFGRRNVKAMACHNIPEEVFNTAVPFFDVAKEIDAHLQPNPTKHFLPAAWGPYFDVSFLFAEYKRIGRAFPFAYPDFPNVIRSFDFRSAAMTELSRLGIFKWDGIAGAMSAVGLSFEGSPHDAFCDIKNSVALFKFLLLGNRAEKEVYEKTACR
jgi:inhibitor of KinA sporulation pathway (predicted exonuclease)